MKRWIFFFTIFLLAGCSEQTIETYTKNEDASMLQQVQQMIKEDPKIAKASIVALNDDWLIAYEIKPLAKWNKTKHEQKLQKKMAKIDSSQKVTVSNDFKIMLEVEKMRKKKLNEKELKKAMKKTKKLHKEET